MVRTPTTTAEILTQIPAARARAARESKAGRRATSARYDARTGRVMVELTSGFMFGFPAKAIPALAKATATPLAQVQVSPAGNGLHWEALDADLSVPALLLASVGHSDKLGELARLAGSSKSAAKAAAARENGLKGGRPRQVAG